MKAILMEDFLAEIRVFWNTDGVRSPYQFRDTLFCATPFWITYKIIS
jgi:hypothetical protein